MTGADWLSEAENTALAWAAYDSGSIFTEAVAAQVEATLADRTASLTAERDAALAAVAGIEDVARRVLGEHGDWGDKPNDSGWSRECPCGFTLPWERTDDAHRVHQAERIASELRGEG